MGVPDLSGYVLHKVIDDIDLEGVKVPGLRGSFHRRRRGRRVHTIGLYEYLGSPVFMAWGFVGEEHCRYTAYHGPDGGWSAPRPGCPAIAVLAGNIVVATGTGEVIMPVATTPAPRHEPAPPTANLQQLRYQFHLLLLKVLK